MNLYQDRGHMAAALLAAGLLAWPLAAAAQGQPQPAPPQSATAQPATAQPATAQPATAQPPAPQPLATAGLWTAFAATGQDQRPVCGLSTTGADGREIIIQQVSGDTGIQVILEKSSWAIPDQTAVDVAFQFDNGGIVAERATGSGTRLETDLPFDRSVAFMRSLRYGSQIRVHFPSGNEGVWTGGLRGTAAMIDAFNECRTRFATTPVTGPTQPFPTAPQPNAAPASPAPTSPAPTSPAPTPRP